jgi:MoaA/NifB/PqqE/SkfB family radical SAM enzyme
LSNSKFLDSVDRFSISIDAGSKEVYEDVRRPGKWEVLLENLDFIKECKKDTIYNFVLQKNNFRDLENCHYLAKKHNANVNVIPMSDWGTWTYQPTNDVPDDWTVKNGFYVDQDVLNHENPFYNECKEYIQHLIDNKVIERINPYISEHLGLTL